MARRMSTSNVLGIIRVVILAIIAIAFVKFAFFPSSANDAQSGGLNPEANYAQITTTPVKGDITNTVSLKGTIEADEPTTVKATLDGEVSLVYVANNAAVNQGDPIVEIRKEMQGETTQGVDEEGNPTVTQGEKWYKYATVYATSSGTISISALVGQQYSIGDTVATIQPPTYSAVASLTSEQMYRLQNAPTAATITIKNGPAPFECSNLQIISPKNQNNQNSSNSSDSSNSNNTQGMRAKCAIPGDQTVFPGLQVTMDMVAGQASGVLLIPISAVEGRYQQGYVYTPSDDPNNPNKVAVTLGLTDGKNVEVKEGLSEGQEILEFVPNKNGTSESNQNEGDATTYGTVG